MSRPPPPRAHARPAAANGQADADAQASPSELIDARIRELGDWRGEMLARLRAIIREADPEVVEEWKWRGTPVWSHDGILCTGETYRSVVKLKPTEQLANLRQWRERLAQRASMAV
jgi:hypothetical protein